MSAELSQSPSNRGSGPLAAADIDAAATRIAGVVRPTPLELSDRLSATTGATVYLKREDLQTVRSYKLRGAYNLLVQLSDDERAAGRGVLIGGQPRAGLRLRVPGRWASGAASTSQPRRPSRSAIASVTTAASASS